MFLFKRKEKEVEEEPVLAKPRKKREKKEVPKEWGKKERLLVVLLFLITTLPSAFFALRARSWKLPGLPRLSFSSIFDSGTSTFWKSETLVFESEDSVGFSILESELAEKTKGLSGVYGIYVYDLVSGRSLGINEKEMFDTASLNKLPVMFAAYLEHENGNLDLDSEYVLRNEDKVEGSGSLFGKPAGTVYTYRELVKKMGKESDNTAYVVMKKKVGDAAITNVIGSLGMEKTDLAQSKTTPLDIGNYFERLWSGSLLTKTSKDQLIDSLTDTSYEAWITAGVPDEFQVVHKYGRETHVVNDAGIILSDKPYILVVLTKGVIEDEADKVIPEISEIVHMFLGN